MFSPFHHSPFFSILLFSLSSLHMICIICRLSWWCKSLFNIMICFTYPPFFPLPFFFPYPHFIWFVFFAGLVDDVNLYLTVWFISPSHSFFPSLLFSFFFFPYPHFMWFVLLFAGLVEDESLLPDLDNEKYAETCTWEVNKSYSYSYSIIYSYLIIEIESSILCWSLYYVVYGVYGVCVRNKFHLLYNCH